MKRVAHSGIFCQTEFLVSDGQARDGDSVESHWSAQILVIAVPAQNTINEVFSQT
jgi:hypothetical protein